MKRLLYWILLAALMLNGCTRYVFEPENSAPKNEHEKIVHKQQQALAEQQKMALDNYRY